MTSIPEISQPKRRRRSADQLELAEKLPLDNSVPSTELAVAIDPGRELLRPRDIEAIYGIPLSTQAKARMTGDTFPYVKRGRSVFAFKSDVENWLRNLRRQSTSDSRPKQASKGNHQ